MACFTAEGKDRQRVEGQLKERVGRLESWSQRVEEGLQGCYDTMTIATEEEHDAWLWASDILREGCP